MSEAARLADPLVDVRDVLETYRLYGLEVADGRAILTSAADRLSHLDECSCAGRYGDLTSQLRLLASGELGERRQLLEQVADTVDALLRDTRMENVLRPDEEYWDPA